MHALLLNLLMVLCLGCAVQFPQACQHCGSAVAPSVEERLPFFESVGPGTFQSPAITRRFPNLIIEVFPLGAAGSVSSIQILDAPLGGQLTNCTDANCARSGLTGYSKWMVKGLLHTVGVSITVTSGSWAVYGTFTEWPSDRLTAQNGLTDWSGSIATGGLSQQLAPANSARQYLFVQNPSNAASSLWINFTAAAVQSQPSIEIPKGSAFEMQSGFVSTEKVTIVGSTTGMAFTAKEG